MKFNIIIRNLQNEENVSLPANFFFQLKNDYIKGVQESYPTKKQQQQQQTLPFSSSSTTFDSSAVINSTDVGAMSPSNHFTFQCPLLNSQPQFKGFDIGGWLVHDESGFPVICGLSYLSFVVKLMHKEVENCLPSFLCNWLPLLSFLVGTF